MTNNTPQHHREDEDLDELEDLPFETEIPGSENTQNAQNQGGSEYAPVQEGEEWIERVLAEKRVRAHVIAIAHGPAREEQERTTRAKEGFLKVYAANMGTIGVACDKANIARETYYLWMKTDPQFRSAVAKIDESRVDMVEDELFALIQKHDGPSIRFFLERKSPEYKAKSQTEIIPTGNKSFEELLYDQAAKNKALAEAKQTDGKSA